MFLDSHSDIYDFFKNVDFNIKPIINNDGSVSVNNDVYINDGILLDLLDLNYMKGIKGKLPVNFKKVSGDFACGSNNLESLEGSPEEVTGFFDCNYNELTSLEFSPRYVGESFYCSQYTSHYPSRLRNISISSLRGCPEYVGNNFVCENNDLESLEFLPTMIKDLYVGNNRLTSFNGVPNGIGKIYCDNNNITNFDGLPEFFEGILSISGNPIDEIYHQLFKRDPKCIYWIREFDVIQGNEVVLDRLYEVYSHMGIKIPRLKPFLKNYKIV